LFNAVRKNQKMNEGVEDEEKEKLSKEKFLELLNKSNNQIKDVEKVIKGQKNKKVSNRIKKKTKSQIGLFYQIHFYLVQK